MLGMINSYLPVSNRKKLRTFWYLLLNNLKREHIYPFYASFKLTARCNLRCDFCNIWRSRVPNLTTEEVFTILDNLDHSSVLVVTLEGGEPFVRKDLLDILKYARTRDLIIGITTNGVLLHKYRAEDYRPYLDFFNVSIDEGHENLHLLDELDGFKEWSRVVTVHTVVTKYNLDNLEERIDRIARAGYKAVVMVASPLEGTPNLLPDMDQLARRIRALEQKYVDVLVTTAGLFRPPENGSACSPASVVISFDGGLYYPCRVKEKKPIILTEVSLMKFLKSEVAHNARQEMRKCQRRCYWYQNFTCADYVNPLTFYRSIRPYIKPNRIVDY